jgi:alkanesulfonate monooxygenase SsuD/methylene tetrahydromethanopterin reductase-like flavin-dependent oxidoreductase (luciferase family)
MAVHPWVAAADDGVRFGVQLVVRPEVLPRLLEAGQLVDRLGFDGLFIFDHPSLQADPWMCLSALSAVTERVRLGSIVNCVPYRHPAHLARLGADLDVLSGGRLVLGLGIGWLASEFRAFDVPMPPIPDRHAALAEAITIITALWGADEPFSFSGQHYRVDELRLLPPPVQRPRPPIVIGGNGERLTLRQVARVADACNINELDEKDGGLEGAGLEAVHRRLDALARHCAEVGRPPDEVLRTHFTLRLVLASTEAAVRTKLDRIEASSAASASPATRRARPSATVAGTPEQVAEHYQARVDAGIQYFVVQVDAADQETLELLATEVMPRVV